MYRWVYIRDWPQKHVGYVVVKYTNINTATVVLLLLYNGWRCPTSSDVQRISLLTCRNHDVTAPRTRYVMVKYTNINTATVVLLLLYNGWRCPTSSDVQRISLLTCRNHDVTAPRTRESQVVVPSLFRDCDMHKI
ncbi:hypothetical protein J6590_064544 [Homalodisca vitripennis]|nr:hypothetical protein J6590_064544 [Homalodisca vitripennis]